MSLCVDVFMRDETGERRILGVPAGFESRHATVWGSATVRSLGARLFPVLADGDLYVEAADVSELLREVLLLREHLDLAATNTERPRGLEEHRSGDRRWGRHLVSRPGHRTAAPGGPGAADVFGERDSGDWVPLPGLGGGGQPISSRDLPLVSLTYRRTKGMERAAKTV
ncbi:hypothetical protein ACVNF4_04980 [Streptomyces sp. S6]